MVKLLRIFTSLKFVQISTLISFRLRKFCSNINLWSIRSIPTSTGPYQELLEFPARVWERDGAVAQKVQNASEMLPAPVTNHLRITSRFSKLLTSMREENNRRQLHLVHIQMPYSTQRELRYIRPFPKLTPASTNLTKFFPCFFRCFLSHHFLLLFSFYFCLVFYIIFVKALPPHIAVISQ